jgi:hypothetical protein
VYRFNTFHACTHRRGREKEKAREREREKERERERERERDLSQERIAGDWWHLQAHALQLPQQVAVNNTPCGR